MRADAHVEIVFTDLLANGQAVGRASGMVVFCDGPLPQERATVAIAAVKQKYAVGKMLALLEESPFRVQPFCPVFGACGGCQVQHLSYPAQLEWKRAMVRDALRRIGGFAETNVRETIGMESPRAYRNKMSLVVDHHAVPAAIGFYRQRSHDVVPVAECPIVDLQLNDYIGRLKAAQSSGEMTEMFGEAKHLVARGARASDQAVLTITTAAPSQGAAEAAPALMTQLPGLAGVTNSFDLSSANAIVGRRQRLLAGKAEIAETIHGIRYRISPGSFFQINLEIVARIFEFMRPGFGAPRRIVDLYCGVGTFALFFAKYGCDVFGIEENRQAVVEARANAALNGFEHLVRFRSGRVEEEVRGGEAGQALRRAQLVFLDPPRRGSDEATLGAIAGAGVPHVWYLSCNPATLARDLKFLAAKGYRVGVVQPFDMFPQTGHVETLVTLSNEVGNRQEYTTLSSDKIDVRYVAKLARIALTDEEVERFGRQLGDLLAHVDALSALDTAAVSATAQVVESRNVERPDVVRPSLDRETVLSQAPQRQGGFFRVPRIIAE